MIDDRALSSIHQKRHVISKKREKKKERGPYEGPSVKKNVCPHVFQIKEREFHKRSISFSSLAIHTFAQS